jgi:hypothetical protein
MSTAEYKCKFMLVQKPYCLTSLIPLIYGKYSLICILSILCLQGGFSDILPQHKSEPKPNIVIYNLIAKLNIK